MRILVLQHIACEPPGVYEDVLRERGAHIRRVELDEHEPLPKDSRLWRHPAVYVSPHNAAVSTPEAVASD